MTSTWESEKRKLKWTGISVRRSSRRASCWLKPNKKKRYITRHSDTQGGVKTYCINNFSNYVCIYSCTCQEEFSFLLCTKCTVEFLGAYFWECAELQSSVMDKYNHWLSLVFWPIQKYLKAQTQRKASTYQWNNKLFFLYYDVSLMFIVKLSIFILQMITYLALFSWPLVCGVDLSFAGYPEGHVGYRCAGASSTQTPWSHCCHSPPLVRSSGWGYLYRLHPHQ